MRISYKISLFVLFMPIFFILSFIFLCYTYIFSILHFPTLNFPNVTKFLFTKGEEHQYTGGSYILFFIKNGAIFAHIMHAKLALFWMKHKI